MPSYKLSEKEIVEIFQKHYEQSADPEKSFKETFDEISSKFLKGKKIEKQSIDAAIIRPLLPVDLRNIFHNNFDLAKSLLMAKAIDGANKKECKKIIVSKIIQRINEGHTWKGKNKKIIKKYLQESLPDKFADKINIHKFAKRAAGTGHIKNNEIGEAIDFILDKVIEPALIDFHIDDKVRDSLNNTKVWVKKFKKVGDLLAYIEGLSNDDKKPEVSTELRRLGLNAFEDVINEFKNLFSDSLNLKTELSDFVIGNTYSAYDIAIFSQVYNNQRGIYIIENELSTEAVFLRVSLDSDSKYPNEWIIKNEELKSYLYSHNGKFDENYKQNRAVVESKAKYPIFTFLKIDENKYLLDGIYQFVEINTDPNGAKWFRLKKQPHESHNLPLSHEKLFIDKDVELSRIRAMTSEERLKRISKTSHVAISREVVTSAYIRSPYVIAETLFRANGICEKCIKPAPFIRKDGSPYLEVHHLVKLSDGGTDDLSNTIALCPNCHREMHFGDISKTEFFKLKNRHRDKN
jgi:5-methylcytosine-specific restriction protein A